MIPAAPASGVRPKPGRSGAIPRIVSLSSRPRAVQFSEDPPRPCTNSAGGRSAAAPGTSLTSRSTPATGTRRAGHSCAPNGTPVAGYCPVTLHETHVKTLSSWTLGHMAGAPQQLTTEVDGQTMKLTNLGKVLYPQTGFTKAEVIDYYHQVAHAAAATPVRPPPDPQTVAGRHRSAVLLREERPARYAGLGADRDTPDARQLDRPGRGGLRGRRRHPDRGLAGQPGRTRAARAAVADRSVGPRQEPSRPT